MLAIIYLFYAGTDLTSVSKPILFIVKPLILLENHVKLINEIHRCQKVALQNNTNEKITFNNINCTIFIM